MNDSSAASTLASSTESCEEIGHGTSTQIRRAPAGSRISLLSVDPASLFPIFSDVNPDELVGWHVIDPFTDNSGNLRIKRLTYRKQAGTGGPSVITAEGAIYSPDNWGGPGMDEEERDRSKSSFRCTRCQRPLISCRST